jgi:hypothetical protein
MGENDLGPPEQWAIYFRHHGLRRADCAHSRTNSAGTARSACLIGGGSCRRGLLPVFVGLVTPLLPGLADPEQLVPSLAEKYC